MKKIKQIGYTVFLILMMSCKTPNLIVSKELQENVSVYEVTGRQGWQFNQVITYGDYTTSKVKRGWELGYNFPFVVHFQGAKEKLNYLQSTPFNNQAKVFCIGKFKNVEIPLIDDFFALTLEYEDYFAGSVKNETLNWNFILYNPDGNSLDNITTGKIINQQNKEEQIIIKAVKKIEGQANWINIDVNGFEFYKNKKAIAAVSLLNKGRVWLSDSMDKDTRLVVSSVITGLMVRHSQSESLNE